MAKKKEDDKKVWVEVEVNKFTDGITVFRGRMQKKDIEAWSNGELVDCSIRLEKTYWFVGENICTLGNGEGNSRQYTGDTYIRVDAIMLIFILKEDSYPNNLVASTDNIFPFPGRQ